MIIFYRTDLKFQMAPEFGAQRAESTQGNNHEKQTGTRVRIRVLRHF